MEKLIKTQVKRRQPISVAMSELKSVDEWLAEETIHHYKIEEILSVSWDRYKETYEVTVKSMPFANTEDFMLISSDSRLESLLP